jgi:hypothetical protein
MAYDLASLSADAIHGKYGHAGIDQFLLTSQIKSVDSDFDVDFADATTLGNEAQNNLPGIPKGMIKMEFVHSPALDYQLQPLKRRQTPVYGWIAKRGVSAGSHIEMFPGSFGKDGSKFDEKSVATENVEFGTRGAFHMGRILLSPKGTLLSGASGLGPVDINTAYKTGATTFGGAAYLYVWDIQGGTSPTFTAKVQHCTTVGGTYVDIPGATFSAASGTLTAPVNWVQQAKVASSVSVNEFLQVSWSTTGSPTGVQALLGFGRSFDPSL